MQEISKIENLQSQIAQIQSISGDISTALSLIDDEKDNTNEFLLIRSACAEGVVACSHHVQRVI